MKNKGVTCLFLLLCTLSLRAQDEKLLILNMRGTVYYVPSDSAEYLGNQKKETGFPQAYIKKQEVRVGSFLDTSKLLLFDEYGYLSLVHPTGNTLELWASGQSGDHHTLSASSLMDTLKIYSQTTEKNITLGKINRKKLPHYQVKSFPTVHSLPALQVYSPRLRSNNLLLLKDVQLRWGEDTRSALWCQESRPDGIYFMIKVMSVYDEILAKFMTKDSSFVIDLNQNVFRTYLEGDLAVLKLRILKMYKEKECGHSDFFTFVYNQQKNQKVRERLEDIDVREVSSTEMYRNLLKVFYLEDQGYSLSAYQILQETHRAFPQNPALQEFMIRYRTIHRMDE